MLYTYKATITDVYDGDTVTALVDLGFHTKTQLRIRLHGINTPELRGASRDAGIKARDRVNELIMGKVVTLITYKDRQEKYGRWLAEIYLPGSEKSINTLLVEEKLAVPFMTE